MKLRYYFFFVSLFLTNQMVAQKREFRAAWISTVRNLDFPTNPRASAAEQKAEFDQLLNNLRNVGMNAVLFQVRSACDAAYQSNYEPYSEYLSGTQGVSPNYDPMAYGIEQSHKRGMEFHAWFNPFRAVVDTRTSSIATNHISNTQPNWVKTYGNIKILDPGLPEVRRYVATVVMDVVRRYDIDAVHFDDYFYPYPVAGQVFDDDATFNADPRGYTNKADWRRNNIDLFVKLIADSIKIIKPYVKFGISPFGIWQNNSATQPNGSNTNGLQSYHDIYADSRKWSQLSWVDYMVPQIYWNIGLAVADYSTLVPWWQANMGAQTQFYVGHAFYKINTTADWNAPQLSAQVRLGRAYAQGGVQFRAKLLADNPLGCTDSLRQLYKNFAFPPPMVWLDNIAPRAPQNVIAQRTPEGVKLTWQPPGGNDTATVLNKVRQYVVYRFENGATLDLNNAAKIRGITIADSTTFIDRIASPVVAANYRYYVTAMDRLYNEGTNSAPVDILVNDVQEIALFSDFRMAPNPFSEAATVSFQLKKSAARVSVCLYDLQGRLLKTVFEDSVFEKEIKNLQISSTDLPKGVLMLLIEVDGVKTIRKIMTF